MKRIELLLWLLSATIFSCTSTQEISLDTRPTITVNTYMVGETKVSVKEQCHYPCDPAVLFVNLHDKEKTSVQAAEKYLNEIGGRLISIENNGERLISFEHERQSYSFDPNRIYSRAGIDSTITILSNNYDATAADEISKFAKSLVTDYVDSSNLIISLHNNRDSTFSVLTYKNDFDLNKG